MTANPLRLKCKACGLISTPPPSKMIGFECPNCAGMEFVTHRDDSVCDFCCKEGEPVVSSYPARDFNVPMPSPALDTNSMGWWAACENCRSLIQAQDRDGLAQRSADIYEAQNGKAVPHALLVRSIRDLHDQFWTNRQGPPIEEIR